MKWITLFVIITLIMFVWGFSRLENNRLQDCKVIVERGVKREATDYEYYDCLSR